MEALFGEMSLALRFFIAFLLVLALIGGAAYVVRRFGAGALTSAAMRGRQPRLAVIDAAPIDGRRRLVLIRRDNVEHLLIIGGPTDVVIEQNIVRAAGASLAPGRPAAATDTLPRAVPLGEDTMWPLQPEPAPKPEATPRVDAPPSRPPPNRRTSQKASASRPSTTTRNSRILGPVCPSPNKVSKITPPCVPGVWRVDRGRPNG